MTWSLNRISQDMAMEKRRQVVADTLCTVPAADIAISMQKTTSPNLVWKLNPKTDFSRFPTAVRRKTKRRDPVNPARMVISWEEARTVLYTCIPLKSSKEMMEDTTNDPPSVRAILSCSD